MYSEGITLYHDIFGEGKVYAYIIVFSKLIMYMSYPSEFKEITVKKIKYSQTK